MVSDWEALSLGNIAEIKTGKLDSNHANDLGVFPFFTCAPNPLRIDNYAFDTDAILLAGNNANGIFHLNIYKGKFNAYQRTYVLTIKDENRSDLRFLYYSLRTVTQKLGTYSLGTATKFLTMKILTPLEIPSPPISEQKAIARILGSLDDKIELNRRMNATLEGMAQALFKSWFLDFDPVIDNAIKAGNPIPAELAERAEVRRQALADGTANREAAKQFPAAFQLTEEMGWIPEGFGFRTIEKVCPFVSRGVTPKYQIGSGRFIINQKVNRGAELDFSNLKELEENLDVPSQKFAQKYDVLINCLGEGTLGRTHFYNGTSNIYAVDQHMTICRPENPQTGLFLYQYLSTPIGKDLIEAKKTGSTGMTMFNIKKVRSFEVPFPTDEALQLYGSSVLGHYQKIQDNREGTRILTNLRDTLLPKLISGELRIPEAEQLAEAALA